MPPRGTVRTKVTLEGDKKMKKQLDGTRDALRGMSGGVKGISSGLMAMGGAAGVAAAGFVALDAAIRLATRAATEAVKLYGELGRRGGAMDAVASQYERIGSPETLARLQQLSGFHHTQIELMRSYTDVMETGMVTLEEYEEWVERMTAAGQREEGGPAAALERMTAAIRGQGLESLSDYGINVLVIRDNLRDMNISAESAEGRMRGLDMALEQLRETQGDVSNEAANLADSWAAITTQATDYFNIVSRIVSTSPAAVAAFEKLRAVLFSTGVTAQDTGGFIAGMMRRAIIAATALVDAHLAIAQRAVEAYRDLILVPIRDLVGALGITIPGMGDFIAASNTIASSMQNARNAVVAAGEAARQAIAVAEGEGAGDGPTVPPGAPGRRGGAAEENEKEIVMRKVNAALAERQRILIAQRELREELLELTVEAARTEISTFWAVQDARTEAFQQEMAQALERKDTLIRWREEEAQAAEEASERATAAADTAMSTGVGILNVMKGIAQAQIAQEKDTEKAKRAEGGLIIAYSSVMAAVSLAESIRAFAKQDYAAGAGHLVAMASYIAAAAQAASDLGGGSAKTPTAGSAGGFTPAQPVQDTTGQQAAENVTIIQYRLGRANGDMGEAMADAEWELKRNGTVPAGQMGIDYG